MCKECGCGEPERNEEIIPVAREILEENARYALHNKEHLRKHGIVMFNFVGSPGAGKTTLLERIIPALREEFKIAVIEGDLETQNDKERIDRLGVPCYQICTHGACHFRRPANPVKVFLKSVAGFGGNLKKLRLGIDLIRPPTALFHIKIQMGHQINLGQHHRIGTVENFGVFFGLVVALGDRKHHHPEILAQREIRRTHQIAYILHEHDVKRIVQVKFVQGVMDHFGV